MNVDSPNTSRRSRQSTEHSRMSKKTAVVTGAAGFLGSHLSDRLLSEGYRVIGIDNLLTGNLRNIEHLTGNADFEFIRHDVTNFINVPGDVHLVFHMASPASPIDYLSASHPDTEGRIARNA